MFVNDYGPSPPVNAVVCTSVNICILSIYYLSLNVIADLLLHLFGDLAGHLTALLSFYLLQT